MIIVSGCKGRSVEEMRPSVSAAEESDEATTVQMEDATAAVAIEPDEPSAPPEPVFDDPAVVEDDPGSEDVESEPEPKVKEAKAKKDKQRVKDMKKQADETQQDIEDIKIFMKVEQTAIDVDDVLNQTPPLP